MTKLQGRTLVLGGGGVTGMAWMAGLFAGLAESGWDISDFDRVIGTSAGSAVGAQLCAKRSAEQMFAMQTDPAKQVAEIKPRIPFTMLALHALPILLARGNETERLRRIGAMARQARTVPWEKRRAIISARLPANVWPDMDFSVTVVDAMTGAFDVLDKSSGVDLVDAVGASCAVPGFWPVVPINGRLYYDGGLRNSENADLAAGACDVVIVSPMTRGSPGKVLRRHIAALRDDGTTVSLIAPDGPSQMAMGRNALDPACRAPSARAGLQQGKALGRAQIRADRKAQKKASARNRADERATGGAAP